jgi:hypothetical protein
MIGCDRDMPGTRHRVVSSVSATVSAGGRHALAWVAVPGTLGTLMRLPSEHLCPVT